MGISVDNKFLHFD